MSYKNWCLLKKRKMRKIFHFMNSERDIILKIKQKKTKSALKKYIGAFEPPLSVFC